MAKEPKYKKKYKKYWKNILERDRYLDASIRTKSAE
jgi:hypothetical protein